MYISWSGRSVDIFNDYNAKMSSVFTDTEVENAILQAERELVVITKDRINVYKRNGDTFCFCLWSSRMR